MISQTGNDSVALQGDARKGFLKQLSITLSVTPATVTTVTLPVGVSGFRITAGAAAIIYAINEDPAALATSNATTIAAAAFSKGNTCPANGTDVRLFDGTQITLRLQSATASATLVLEVF